jgi:hypothetical protein
MATGYVRVYEKFRMFNSEGSYDDMTMLRPKLFKRSDNFGSYELTAIELAIDRELEGRDASLEYLAAIGNAMNSIHVEFLVSMMPEDAKHEFRRIEFERAKIPEDVHQLKSKSSRKAFYEHYKAYVDDVASEGRLAEAYWAIDAQVNLNKEYAKEVGKTSDLVDRAVHGGTYTADKLLEKSTTELEMARDRVTFGGISEIESLYSQSIKLRIDALEVYGTEKDLYFTPPQPDGVSYNDPLESIAEEINTGRKKAMQERTVQYKEYFQLHADAIHAILTDDKPGRNSRLETSKVQMEAMGMIDTSMFGVPVRTFANTYVDYAVEQNEVRNDVLAALHAYANGNITEGDALIEKAGSKTNELLTRADNINFAGKVAATVANIGISFVFPGVGLVIDLAMQCDSAYTESVTEGHVSARTWINLALTPVIYGMDKFGDHYLKPMKGNALPTTRAIKMAKRWKYVSNAINLGSTTGSISDAKKAFSEGDIKEGVFSTTMAVFSTVMTTHSIVHTTRIRERGKFRGSVPVKIEKKHGTR